MARRPKKPPRPQLRDQHWLTLVALACITLFGLTVIVTNAFGWPRLIPGPLGIVAAILAICAGGFAFSLWEHVRLFFRERRWPNFAGALVFFIGALVIDGIGVHSGIETLATPWVQEMERDAQADQGARQRDLDKRRADLQREINNVQARIDALAPPPRSGPQTTAEDRETWLARTADDRARLKTQQDRLDAMPRSVAAEPAAPWLSPAITAFAVFAEMVVAFGVSILGIEIAPRFVKGREEDAPPKPTPVQPAAVISISEARPARAKRVRSGGDWSGWN